MKRKPGIARRIKKFREDHYPSQKALADALRVGQTVVSAWETGDNEPSPEAWVKLGNLAGYPECKWFWEKAGIGEQAIAAAGEKILKERGAAPLVGEVIHVPRLRETPQGRESAGPQIPLPAEFIPNPLSTICLVVDNRATALIRSPRAIFILDESEKGMTSLSPFWGQVVFIRYSPESGTKPNPHAPPGIYMGRIGCVPPNEPSAEMIFWAVGRLALIPKDVGLPLVVGRFEYDARNDLSGIDPDYTKALKDPRMPSVRAVARELALRELRLEPGWCILGRVLGRLKLKGIENE
jgi:transcriptional regulator with XRE-family HTH domain